MYITARMLLSFHTCSELDTPPPPPPPPPPTTIRTQSPIIVDESAPEISLEFSEDIQCKGGRNLRAVTVAVSKLSLACLHVALYLHLMFVCIHFIMCGWNYQSSKFICQQIEL